MCLKSKAVTVKGEEQERLTWKGLGMWQCLTGGTEQIIANKVWM